MYFYFILLFFCKIEYFLANTCTSKSGLNIPGNDIRAISGKPEDECCQLCAHERKCKAYVYDGTTCFLKTSNITIESEERFNVGILSKKDDIDIVQCGHPSFDQDEDNVVIDDWFSVSDKWPWMVAIFCKMEDGDWQQCCGGSLISSRTVVTAAHCLKDYNDINNAVHYQVRFGAHDIYGISEELNGQQPLEKANILLHPSYNKSNSHQGYDIAIITLPSAVTYTPSIQPLCLGKPFQLPADALCFVTGWGLTSLGGSGSNVLKELRFPIIHRDECKRLFNTKKRTFNSDIQICAGYIEGKQYSCKRDSGGPFVCKDPKSDVWRLQGIVSYGFGCAVKGEAGVYTRVSYFSEWIKKNALIDAVSDLKQTAYTEPY